MASGFVGSREFIVAVSVVACVVVGGAFLVAADGFAGLESRRVLCATTPPSGTALAAEPTDETSSRLGRVERVVTYVVDADGAAPGSARLCVGVGGVDVVRAEDGAARLVFTIASDGPRAEEVVKRAEVGAAFATNDAGGLAVAGWESEAAWTRGWFGSGDHASVRIRLELPGDSPYGLKVSTDVGDVAVRGLAVGAVEVSTDVGEIRVRDVRATADVRLSADVGDISYAPSAVESARYRLSTDVGGVVVTLPARADVGYHVSASTDVGDVYVSIGDTEGATTDGEGPGEKVETRSSGYATKPTQVRVEASSDVGDIHVRARE